MIIGVDIRVLGTGRQSGIEEYTEQLLAHMIPLDSSVQYKLFYAGRRPLDSARDKPWMRAPNVEIFDTGRSNRALWLRTRLTGRPYLDHLVGGADIFFFPHFLLGAISPKCRRVMTWHDLSYERMPEFLSWGRRFWHQMQMRPRRQAAGADRIISVSQSTARDLTALYDIDEKKITVIHSGSDAAIGRLSDAALREYRQATGLPNRFILALGTREPRKNLETLVRAFDRLAGEPDLRDVELIIAGPAGWGQRALLKTIARAHQQHRIRIIGSVLSSQRAALLSAASVLAYPSWLEGFGFPPLEAMTCGTPVVTGATSAIAEVCGMAVIGVHPSSVSAFQNALTEVLRDDALRRRMITAGYDRVRQFSWQRSAQETLHAILSTQ